MLQIKNDCNTNREDAMTTSRILMAAMFTLTMFPICRSEARQNAYYEEEYLEEAPSDDDSLANDGNVVIIQRPDVWEDNGRRDSDHDRRNSEGYRHRKKKLSRKEYLKQFHYTTGEIKATSQGQNPRGR
jgi:hypothetical protein